MRNVRWLGGVVGLLGAIGPVAAQAVTGDAVIRQQQAEVRGRDSTLISVTGVLRRGQHITVIRDDGDWLAIQPPQGSSSWINERFIRFEKRPQPGERGIATVLQTTPVLLGTPDPGIPPSPVEEPVKVQTGSLVVTLGETVMHDNAQWWRIEPPPATVRYVRREAIAPPAQVVSSASPVNSTAPASAPAGTRPALLAQAEQAEAAGNLALADSLYRQLAQEMSQPNGDHDMAIRCYNRSEMLQRQMLTGQYASRPAGPTVGTLTSTSRVTPVPAYAPPPPVNTSPVVTSGPGWLRRTSFQIDGKPAYVLEDNAGQFRMYVTPQPGLNMEPYINRCVQLFGPMVARADLAGGGQMSVGRLHLLR